MPTETHPSERPAAGTLQEERQREPAPEPSEDHPQEGLGPSRSMLERRLGHGPGAAESTLRRTLDLALAVRPDGAGTGDVLAGLILARARARSWLLDGTQDLQCLLRHDATARAGMPADERTDRTVCGEALASLCEALRHRYESVLRPAARSSASRVRSRSTTSGCSA